MRAFCTAFDSDRLFQGLALYHSLARHEPGAELWVLCLDRTVETVLAKLELPGLRTLPLPELEATEKTLHGTRSSRTRSEYHLTCTPTLLWHVLTRVPDTAPLTFLEPDVFFFASPAPVVAEASTGSVALLSHRFPPALEHLRRYGIYDPCWVTFLDDRAGRESLAYWRNRCIEWCQERLEDGKFGAQKYLDDWTTRFQGVHVLTHAGAGVAPWNVAAHPVTSDAGGPRVGGAPLVFYHFHGLERVDARFFDPGLIRYRAELTHGLEDVIYRPYLSEVLGLERELRRKIPGLPRGWPATGLGARLGRVFRRQLLEMR